MRCFSGQLHRLLPVAAALGLAACASDPSAPFDAGTSADASTSADAGAGDASAPLDGSLRPDAGRDAGTFDGNELRDATPGTGTGDESIRGTPLEGLALTWSAPVTLCTRWREGQTIAEERAAKAQVTVWPAPRASLGSGHLAEATLPRVDVKRSPLAEAEWSATAITSALVDYRLVPQGSGAISVAAELEHDLGPAGVLVETFSVYRAPGDTRPVAIGGGLFEHAFALRGRALGEAALLEPCDGPDTLDEGVHVLVAERGGAHLALTRYARTVDAVAGSAPVYIAGLDVSTGDVTRAPWSGRGFWFATYAAQHHNWNDTSHFDFAQDLASWTLLFQPWGAGEPVPAGEVLETVDLRGVSGWDAPAEVDLGYVDLPTGAARTETWSVPGRSWVRVDRAAPGLQPTCPGGQVLTLGDYSAHVLQVVICPRGQFPGVGVERVIPVRFAEVPAAIGQPLEHPTETLEGGRAAFTFPVGPYAVTLRKGSDAAWLIDVRDAGGALVSEALAAATDLWPRFEDEALAFTTPAGDVTLKLVRRAVALGEGESWIYAPLLLEATALGRTFHVEAWDRLDYDNTHHNWRDALVATTEDATLTWRTDFLAHTNTLEVRARDGAELLPETPLETMP